MRRIISVKINWNTVLQAVLAALTTCMGAITLNACIG